MGRLLRKLIATSVCIVQIVFPHAAQIAQARIPTKSAPTNSQLNPAPQLQYPADVDLTDIELSQALRNINNFFAIPLDPEDPKSMKDEQIVEELAKIVVADRRADAALESIEPIEPSKAIEKVPPPPMLPPSVVTDANPPKEVSPKPAPPVIAEKPSAKVSPPFVAPKKAPEKAPEKAPAYETIPSNSQGFLAKLASSVVLFGQKKAAFESIKEIVGRLRVAKDAPTTTLEFSGAAMPNAWVEVGAAGQQLPVARTGVTAGLIGFVKNQDELAYVMAHEMTHANPEHMNSAARNEEVDRILNSVSGFRELDPGHQEELRADMGAIDRMIRAGYNPWAAYDLLKRIETLERGLHQDRILDFFAKRIYKRNTAYNSTHPANEVRMAAIKAMMLHKRSRVDLSEHISKYTPLSPGMKILKARMAAYQFAFTNPWALRAQPTAAVYYAASATGITSSTLWTAVADRVAELTDPVWSVARPVTEAVGRGAGFAWDAVGSLMPSGSVVGTTALGALATVGIGGVSFLVKEAVRPNNPELREIKEAVKAANVLLKQEAEYAKATDPKEQIRALTKIGESLNVIDGNFAFLAKFHKVLQSLSYLNGIDAFRRKASEQRIQVMEKIAEAIERVPAKERAELRKPVFMMIKDTPGYVQSDKRYFNADEKFYRLSYAAEAERDPEIEKFFRIRGLKVQFANRDKLSVDDKFKLALAFNREKVDFFAPSLIAENLPRFIEHAFSKDKVSKADATEFIELVNSSKQIIDQIEQSASREASFDRAISGETIKSWAKGPEARFAVQGLSAGVGKLQKSLNPVVVSSRAFRALTDGTNRKVLSYFLGRNFSSVSEVVTYIEKELIPRNVPVENLATDFFSALKQHPEWIGNRADVDALLKSRIFWPAMEGLESRLGSMERHLYDRIKEAAKANPKMWEFEPGASEISHRAIIAGLKKSGQFPTSYEDKFELWKSMTSRGITTATDAFYTELFDEANPKQKAELKQLAVDGHVWEEQIRAKISREGIFSSESYEKLLAEKDPTKRSILIDDVVHMVKMRFPERGAAYREVLEDISTSIRSTQTESSLLQREKGLQDPGKTAQDQGARTLSAIIAETKKWKKEQQWDFIRYLRGDIEATKHIEQNFRAIGPERVRRMYTLLPTIARAGLIDVLLDGGLLPKTEMGKGYTRRIVEHLVRAANPKEREISIQILDAFLYSQQKVGDGALRSSTLSYLLAVSKKGDKPMSAGEVLKNVLEQFGSSGVKIGQFLSAANILSPEENKFLDELHANANKPERETVYRDLREIVGVDAKGQAQLPVEVGEVLGSASIKYTVGAKELQTGQDVVLKVLRLSSIAQTPAEFKQLEAMADYLRRVYGPRFGIFKSIVRASRRAVEKELSLPEEVKKGRLAAKVVYPDRTTDVLEVRVPREVLLKERLIAAEFAPGSDVSKLPTNIQKHVFADVLQMEEANLFSSKDVIYFDPDRHPGNSRAEFDGKSIKVKFAPIDFGQLSSITREQRDQVVDLFALAQVLARTGKTKWATEQISTMMKLDSSESKKLSKQISQYFPAKNISEPAAYFSVLSALEEAGRPMDIVFYDFVRGIIQHRRFDGSVDAKSRTPMRTFTARVTDRAQVYADGVKKNMKVTEKLSYAARGSIEEVRSFLSVENPVVAKAKERVDAVTSIPAVKVSTEFTKGAGQVYLAELVSAVFWSLVDKDKAKAEEFLKSLMTLDKHVGFGAFAVAAELYKAIALSATDLAKAKLRYLHMHGGSMAVGMVASDLSHRLLKGESWEQIADEMVTMPYGSGILLSTANFMIAGALVGATFSKIQNSPTFKVTKRLTGCPDIFGKFGKLAGTFIVAEGLDRAYKETILGAFGYDSKTVERKRDEKKREEQWQAERRALEEEFAKRERDRRRVWREKPELFEDVNAFSRLYVDSMRGQSWVRAENYRRRETFDPDDSGRRVNVNPDQEVAALVQTFGVRKLKEASGGRSGRQFLYFVQDALDNPKFDFDNDLFKAARAIRQKARTIADPIEREVYRQYAKNYMDEYLSSIEGLGRSMDRLESRARSERQRPIEPIEIEIETVQKPVRVRPGGKEVMSHDADPNGERVKKLLETPPRRARSRDSSLELE